jgi:hypothetical protein
VEFATATEAMVEFLDYYTPQLEAYVAPVMCGGHPRQGIYEYGVRLLGAGIRVDERHPVKLHLLPPPLFQSCEVERLRVMEGEELLAEECSFDPACRPAIAVTLARRPADLRIQVLVKPVAIPLLASFHDHEASGLRYREPPEAAAGPLFELALPRNGDFTAAVLRLLMNPVAGASDPLGRRIHPLGVFLMGAAITTVLESAGQAWQPWKLRLRWRKPLALDADLRAVSRPLAPHRFEVRMRDHTGNLVAESVVELRAAAQAAPALSPAPEDQRYAALLAGIRQYDDCLHQRLAEYRGQRAWKVMRWIRSAYAILFRQGWAAFFRWLPHSFSATHEDLTFPKLSDFVDR